MLEKLAAEQIAGIPEIRERWKRVAFSTESLKGEEAVKAVEKVYLLVGKSRPELVFVESPYAALVKLASGLNCQVGRSLGRFIRDKVHSSLYQQLRLQVSQKLLIEIYDFLYNPLHNELMGQFHNYLVRELEGAFKTILSGQSNGFLMSQLYGDNCIVSELSACHGSWVEFCISVLQLDYDAEKWEGFRLLTETCGWVYPFETVCLVCNRSQKIYWNSQGQLHCETAPALEFADKFSVYVYRGVRLPKDYGQWPVHQWQAQWLLTEKMLK